MTKFEEELEKSKEQAIQLFEDVEKTKDMISKAYHKAEKHKHFLSKIWNKLQLFFSLLRDYIIGEYREIPFASIIAIVAGLSYFLTPIDLLPDIIPGIGYIDDIAVISFIYTQLLTDLEKYEQWKDN